MSFPSSVDELLKNNNLLHLATSKDDVPSVSLMSFSYVEPTDSRPATIILSSPPGTQKVSNIKANPKVSVLIHDWTSQRHASDAAARGHAVGNLSQYLEKINQSQLGQTSVTLYGHARIPMGEEAEYFRAKHLEANPDSACFIKDADIVLVVPHTAKVADSNNNVQSFDLEPL